MTWNDAKAKFAEHFPNFEERAEQDSLAAAIERAVTDGEHLAAQAGTGVGKSYGGLIPMIDWAIANGETAVVSTGTKALQNQYVRDLTTLAEVYRPFRWVLLKGRSNYACHAKLSELGPNAFTGIAEVREELAQPDADGDLERLNTPIDERAKWLMSTSSEECPGKNECPFGDVCFANRAKQAAQGAHIVIANHALTVTDAAIGRGALLPQAGRMLIDEAHELPEIATSMLSNEVSSAAVLRLAKDVGALLNDRLVAEKVEAPVDSFFGALGRLLPKDETQLVITPAFLLELEDPIVGLLTALQDLDLKVRTYQPVSDTDAQKRKRLAKRADNMLKRVYGVVEADFAALVRWIEKDAKYGVLLKFSPIEVGDFLRNNIWDDVPTTLMSATLAVGTDFEFLRERLGFTAWRTFDTDSPFDYTEQARTFVPKDFPEPSGKDLMAWRSMSTAYTGDLVKASDGRALLLYTSRSEMDAAYRALAPRIQSMGHRVLKQGDLPNQKLGEIFRDDEHSVLFAMKSFFTGFDIQGDSLRLVVINKLTFTPPNDVVTKARCDAIDAKNGGSPWGPKGSFEKYTIPMMIFTLLQGFGRGIRSKQDRALIAIFDPRLHTKRYGKTVLNALPPAPLLTNVNDAVAYLESLEA